MLEHAHEVFSEELHETRLLLKALKGFRMHCVQRQAARLVRAARQG